jgi:hypothetical protein
MHATTLVMVLLMSAVAIGALGLLLCRTPRDPPAGQWLPLWRVLPDTLGAGLRVLENPAWRCESCQLILLDHSHMIDRRQAGRTQ